MTISEFNSSAISSTNSEELVEKGYGEFVVTLNHHPVDFATFHLVQKLLQTHSPVAWANQGLNPENRLPELRNKIAKIDPRIQLTFVPRCLYELFLIKKIIENEVSLFQSVVFKDLNNPSQKELSELRAHALEKICPSKVENDRDLNLKMVLEPFELNTILANHVPNSGVFTRKKIHDLAKDILLFLEIQATYLSTAEITKKRSLLYLSINQYYTPIFSYLRLDQLNSKHIKFILFLTEKVIDIECLPENSEKAIFYRGSYFIRDQTVRTSKIPHSLSYGTGIFTGLMRDPGATPFCYMQNQGLDGYALAFPLDKENQIFAVPREPTIAQIYGKGEFFHGRTKVSKDSLTHSTWISGVSDLSDDPEINKIFSDLSAEKIEEIFQTHKKKAILLKIGNHNF